MAAASAHTELKDTDCSVCHELFTKPKLLPCAHVLCRHCLLSWLDANPEALCPLCRCAIVDPGEESKTKGWEGLVNALPDDVAMAALVESARVLSQDHVCAGCQESAAKSICLHCGDTLCVSCTKAHRNLTATRHHKTEPLSAMTAERLSLSQFAACDSHSDKPSELFCPTHGAAICHLCASSEHRACPEVTLFEKRVEELRKELSSMADTLQATEHKLDKAITSLEQQLQSADQQAHNSLAEIDKACDRLETAIRECRRRLKQLTEAGKQQVHDDGKEMKSSMLERRARLKSYRRVTERVKLTSPPGSLEQATATVRRLVKGLDLGVADVNNSLRLKTIKIDQLTLARLEKDFSFLGAEKQTTAKASEEDLWQFVKSKNIVLSNNGQTAAKVQGNSAIVFSTSPMRDGILYEVRIDKIKGKSLDTFPCGVVSTPPKDLILPQTTLDGWRDAVVFSYEVFDFGSEKNYGIEDRLRNLKEGTRVGFVREGTGYLHLYIDGEKQWVYIRNAPKGCYPFFELLHIYQQVTTLPLTAVKKAVKKY